MPKVFLFGYYGFGNLGDELLSAYYISLIRDHFPGVKLFVLKSTAQQRESRDYTVLNRWNLWKLQRLMAPGDLLLGGGGSIFQDRSSKRSLLYYLTLLQIPRSRGAEIILAGQGIGPLSSWGRRVAGPVLNQTLAIGCRDQASCNALQEMGVVNPRFYVGVDPLWDFPMDSRVSAGKRSAKPTIGYIWRPGESRAKQSFLMTLASRYGPIKLLVFSPADRQSGEEVAAKIGSPPPQYIKDLTAFGELTMGLTMVISERLHGLVLAARYGLPGIGLSADPKVSAFCHQMTWPCWAWNAPNLAAGVMAAIEDHLVDPTVNYQKVRRQAAIMEQKGEEDRRWLLHQLQQILPGQ
ncbi:MAG TPA: hypothetical protein DD734_08170 [Firmicutes bacterium]|nr:hypothetical protein [Bacillota bacterium]